MFALEAQFLPQVGKLLVSAEAAVQYTAMLLGRVTYEATNHCSTTADSCGHTVKKWLRDCVECIKFCADPFAIKRPSEDIVKPMEHKKIISGSDQDLAIRNLNN